jgi:Periplasmic component of the Tol biopolymer transport system
MRLNTFKCLSLGGALALITPGCSDPVGSETATNVPQPIAPKPIAPKPIAPIVQGQIVFFENEATGYGIFVANSDGARLGRISPLGALDIDPAVSRDGNRIAYSGAIPNGNDWNIFVMNADGSNRVRVTSLPGSNDRPAWSPDGKRIAFESTADLKDNQIYVVNADGTGPTQLTFSKGNSGSPEWSSDGTRILFDRDLNGWENKGIFSMNPDGTNVTQLTSGHFDWQPTWSPDGKRVAFVRDLDGARELFVVNADGSDTKQLTFGINTVSDPAWSPDGTSIAFGFVSASKMCVDVDDEYGYDSSSSFSFPCGHDVERVSLDGVIDPRWVLSSAYNAAWQR